MPRVSRETAAQRYGKQRCLINPRYISPCRFALKSTGGELGKSELNRHGGTMPWICILAEALITKERALAKRLDLLLTFHSFEKNHFLQTWDSYEVDKKQLPREERMTSTLVYFYFLYPRRTSHWMHIWTHRGVAQQHVMQSYLLAMKNRSTVASLLEIKLFSVSIISSHINFTNLLKVYPDLEIEVPHQWLLYCA